MNSITILFLIMSSIIMLNRFYVIDLKEEFYQKQNSKGIRYVLSRNICLKKVHIPHGLLLLVF